VRCEKQWLNNGGEKDLFRYRIINGDAHDALMTVEDRSVQCCVTSPPYYGLRDYGADGQIGVEDTPEEYIDRLVSVFREVRRVLKDDGTLWLNIGDSYAGSGNGRNADGSIGKISEKQRSNRGSTIGEHKKFITDEYKPKDLIGIPWMLAFALRADGWYLRQDIIWHKPNPMPESVTDRCTKAHEYVFLLSKSQKYYFDHEAIQEKADPKYEARYKSVFNAGKQQNTPRQKSGQNTCGMKTYTGSRNKRDVWSVPVKAYRGAHFATFPEDLITPMILAGSRDGDTVLDPFMGSGTTGYVCKKLGRNFLGTELNPEYVALAKDRIDGKQIGLEDYIEEAGG
jgi:DNA modification methylase